MGKRKKSYLCTKHLDKVYQVNPNLKKLVHGEHAHCFIFVWFIGTPHPHPHSDKIDFCLSYVSLPQPMNSIHNYSEMNQ